MSAELVAALFEIAVISSFFVLPALGCGWAVCVRPALRSERGSLEPFPVDMGAVSSQSADWGAPGEMIPGDQLVSKLRGGLVDDPRDLGLDEVGELDAYLSGTFGGPQAARSPRR